MSWDNIKTESSWGTFNDVQPTTAKWETHDTQPTTTKWESNDDTNPQSKNSNADEDGEKQGYSEDAHFDGSYGGGGGGGGGACFNCGEEG